MLFDLEIRVQGSQEGRQRVRLVDLPGYGYAQVSHSERHAWQVLVEGYVKKQTALVLVLVDARRELGAEELQIMEWLQLMQAEVALSADGRRTGWPRRFWGRLRLARVGRPAPGAKDTKCPGQEAGTRLSYLLSRMVRSREARV